mgnify:FL=1
MLKSRKDFHDYFDRILADEKMRTHVLSLFVSVILFILGLFMCILNLFTGTLYLVFLTGGLAAVLAVIIFLLTHTEREKTGLFLLSLSVLVLLSLLLINGGLEGFSSIWILILPFTAFSLFGLKSGGGLSLAMLVVILIVLWSPLFSGIRYDYSRTFVSRFPIVYISCMFIGTSLEYERETSQRLIRKSQSQLKQLSRIDELTKLENRRAFDKRLNELWADAVQQGQPLSLLMIDIDFFKAYNDYYGHLEGDLVLINVARIISETIVHDREIAARWGGEEFSVLLPHDALEKAIEKAQKVRLAILAKAIPHEKSGSPLKKITVSIGVSTLIPSVTKSSRELLAQADKALYRAKNEGRNRVAF